MLGTAGLLRRHLGLVHDEETWREFRESVTEAVKDHLDLSPNAPSAPQQEEQIKKALEQIYHENPKYFPRYSRSEDEEYVEKYLIERFHEARKTSRMKEARGSKADSQRNRRTRQPPSRFTTGSDSCSDTIVQRRKSTRVVVVRPNRNKDTNTGSCTTRRTAPSAAIPGDVDPKPQNNELLEFLSNCGCPLTGLYQHLKKHGHTMESIVAMSEWDFELIQRTFRQLAELTTTSKDNCEVSRNRHASGGGSSNGQRGRVNVNAEDEMPVTLAQWDLLVGYVYRLGH